MTVVTLHSLTSVVMLAALAAAGTARAEGPSVTVRDAVARVQVIPEARSDVSVTVTPGRRPLPTVRVYREGDRTVVDGGLAHRIRGCGWDGFEMGAMFSRHRDEKGERGRATVSGIGRLGPEDMPLITIRTPMDAHVSADGAVFGRVGATHSLELSVAGCGDWSTEDVAGLMAVHVSGSGDVAGGRAGALRAGMSGSGDLKLTRVDGDADISTSGSSDVRLGATGPVSIRIGGSSDVRIGDVNGPIHTEIGGSGDVTIDRGRAPDVRVAVAGSGDFRFHGSAGSVSASVAGSGDVVIDHASGPVSQRKAGSGDIHIGR
jgi:hypothetical protein